MAVTVYSRPKAPVRARRVQMNWSMAGTLLSSSDQTVVLTPSLEVERKEKTSFTTPNYRNLVRSNATLPDQNFSFKTKVLNPGMVVYGAESYTSGVKTSYYRSEEDAEYWCENNHGPTRLTQSMLNLKLLEKQRSNQWNLPVFFAEAGKTTRMVLDRAWHLSTLVRALRRGDANRFLDGLRSAVEGNSRRRAVSDFNRHYGRRPSQAAANMWLEYSYGWTPFMKDVQDATNTLMDMADDQALLVGTTKASIRDRWFWRNGQTVLSNSYCQLVDANSVVLQSMRGTWHWEPLPGTIPARLGLTNPLVVAWELLPFSFVADWFLPIGDYLSQLDTPFRVRHLGGTYGDKQVTAKRCVVQPRPNTVSSRYQASGETRSEIVTVVRTPMTSVPSVSLTSLPVSAGLGARRITSALALLRQNLSGLRR